MLFRTWQIVCSRVFAAEDLHNVFTYTAEMHIRTRDKITNTPRAIRTTKTKIKVLFLSKIGSILFGLACYLGCKRYKTRHMFCCVRCISEVFHFKATLLRSKFVICCLSSRSEWVVSTVHHRIFYAKKNYVMHFGVMFCPLPLIILFTAQTRNKSLPFALKHSPYNFILSKIFIIWKCMCLGQKLHKYNFCKNLFILTGKRFVKSQQKYSERVFPVIWNGFNWLAY